MQPKQSKTRHGGRRKGAGRKPIYGEPTKLIRVPESQVPVVSRYLDALKQSVPSAAGVTDAALRPIAAERTATHVPALGRQVRAGEPASGDDYLEDVVDLGRHLVRDPASTFLMKVNGWSMRDAGIAHGDELVVDCDVSPDDGRVVVAEVDGELTVKRLKKSAVGWSLQAANPDFDDVPVHDKNALHIWGVVTRVLHRP
jgi:DNA polymerase V